MAAVTVRLSLTPSSSLTSMLGELQSLSDAGQESLLFENGFQSLLNTADSLHELFLIKSDIDTTGVAMHLGVCLDPSDRFFGLLAAVRAGDSDALVVKNIHEKDLLLVGAAVDSHPHHTSQQEAPLKQDVAL